MHQAEPLLSKIPWIKIKDESMFSATLKFILIALAALVISWLLILTVIMLKNVTDTEKDVPLDVVLKNLIELKKINIEDKMEKVHSFNDLSQELKVHKTSVNVSEHGANYQQEVEYDPTTMAIKITVPAHHNIDASTLIIHKQSHTRILMDPVRKLCKLYTLEDSFDPMAQIVSFFTTSSTGVVLTPEAAKEVYRLSLDEEEITKEQREQLLPSMQELCEGLPITRVEEIDVTKEEYESGSLDIFNSTIANHRNKRSFGFGMVSCGGQMADRCTDAKDAHYCVWYTCATLNVGGVCDIEHMRNGSWRCLKCCENKRDQRMCKCSEITDKSSFLRCQNRNWGR